MYKNLEQLGIVFDQNKIDLFEKYIELFIQYNQNVNLVSKNEVEKLYPKHIFDSLAFNLFKEKYVSIDDFKLMDIGCGGGFPSVPIALNYEKVNVLAVDSINKKINFLKELSLELGLKNLNPICSRVEELPLKYRASMDVVTTRAMAELRMILEYAIPFVKNGGYFVAYKSKKADEELKNAKNALNLLGVKLIDKIEYKLPIDEDNVRTLLIFQKMKETNKKYPRANGIVKKSPL